MTTPTIGVSELAAGGAVLVVAFVVARTAGQRRDHRLLAIILTVEGFGQMAWGVHDWFGAQGPIAERFFQLGLFTFGVTSLLYLLLVRRLASPLATPLRSPPVLALGALLTVGTSGALAGWSILHPGGISIATGPSDPSVAPYFFAFGLGLLAVFAYALATSISAWRRATPGTAMRKKAGAFALAFGARDAIYVMALLFNVLLASTSGGGATLAYVLWPLGSFVYAILLGYGILRLQLFDIDLKVKSGISRSAVAAVGIAAVLIAAKITEFYLSSAVGIVAGGVMAGLALFLAPRLNKLGDRVANTAMPNVHATSDYLAYKKVEVYRTAVETALEDDGLIDTKERVMLERLRGKLAISETDAREIELELSAP